MKNGKKKSKNRFFMKAIDFSIKKTKKKHEKTLKNTEKPGKIANLNLVTEVSDPMIQVSDPPSFRS